MKSQLLAHKWLLVITLGYLIIPNVIFCLGWMSVGWGLLATGLCLAPLGYLLAQKPLPHGEKVIPLPAIIAACVLALGFTSFSGTGGFGFQQADWLKHNTLLKDLIEQPWPVAYTIKGVLAPITYYVGYYLPAAVAGKIFGWTAANVFLFGYTVAGYILAAIWALLIFAPFSPVTPRWPWWMGLGILFGYSGLDILGYVLIYPLAKMYTLATSIADLEWWSIAWNYPSPLTLIVWCPNQALATWLVGGIGLYGILNNQYRSVMVFVVALSAIWMPFVTAGMAVILIGDFLLGKNRREYASAWNLLGSALLLPMGSYYLSKIFPTLPAEITAPDRLSLTILLSKDNVELIFSIFMTIIFCVIEFGLIAFLVNRLWKQADRIQRRMLKISVTALAIIPWFYYGFCNDLSLKGTLVFLYTLAICVGFSLQQSAFTPDLRKTRIIVSILLLIGLTTNVIVFTNQVYLTIRQQAWFSLKPIAATENLLELRDKTEATQSNYTESMSERGTTYNTFLTQYLGSGESFFFRVFSKPLTVGIP